MKLIKKEKFLPAAALIMVFILLFGIVPFGKTGSKVEYSTAAESAVNTTRAAVSTTNGPGIVPTSYYDGYQTYNHLRYRTKTRNAGSEDEYEYISIAGYENGIDKQLVIPDAVNGIPVEEIENLSGAPIVSVTIPDSVSKIDKNAFRNCFSVESITADSEFFHVENECLVSNATGKVIFCTSKAICEIPEGRTRLYEDSFEGYENAYKLVLPASMEQVDYYYERLENLKEIEVNEQNSRYASFDGMLCEKFDNNPGLHLMYCPPKKTSVTVDDSVICDYFYSDNFFYCTQITDIDAGNSQNYRVADGVLYYCGSEKVIAILAVRDINQVNWPADLSPTEIGSSAFAHCKNLNSISIPGSVNYIYDNAFNSCTGLTSLTITEGVTDIDGHAFYCCTGLTSITIPDSVTYIGSSAFYGCTKLSNIVIPAGINIGSSAFHDTAFYNNNANWENGALYLCGNLIRAKETVSGSYNVKSGTKSIAAEAFSYCNNLTGITVPDSVVCIGDHAFSNCTNLREAEFGSGLNYLGYDSFINCTALKQISIPGENANYTSQDGVLYNKDKTEIIAFPYGKTWADGTFTIPASVNYFNQKVFRYSYNVKGFRYSGTEFTAEENGVIYGNDNNLIFIPNLDRNIYTVKNGTEYVRLNHTTFSSIHCANTEFFRKANGLDDYYFNSAIGGFYNIDDLPDNLFYDSTNFVVIPGNTNKIYFTGYWYVSGENSYSIFIAQNQPVIIYNGTKAEAQEKFGEFISQANEDAGIYSAPAVIICNPNGKDISRLITPEITELKQTSDLRHPVTGKEIKNAIKVSTVSGHDLELSITELTEKEKEDIKQEGYVKLDWFDISLKRDGVSISPDNPVDIYFSKEYLGNDPKAFYIIHQKNDGTKEQETFLYNADKEAYRITEGTGEYKNYWKITVTSLSPFAIYKTNSETGETPAIKIKANPGTKNIDWGQVLRLEAEAPKGYEIRWFTGKTDTGKTGTSFDYDSKKGNSDVKAVLYKDGKAVKADGKEICDSEKVTVNSGFLKKLIAFFKYTLFRVDNIVTN